MVALVADIGGTNARFALVEPERIQPSSNETPLSPVIEQSVVSFAVADFETFEAALTAYLQQCEAPQMSSGVVAVATPVLEDQLVFTNSHWRFSQDAIRHSFGMPALKFINDFSALALAIPQLSRNDLKQIGVPALPAQGKSDVVCQIRAVVGAGTGFGVSALLTDSSGSRAIEGEGGHSMMRVRNAREFALQQQLTLMRQTSHGDSYVSAENMLSGPGLEQTYRALLAIDAQQAQAKDAADILQAGLSGTDAYARETLDLFCQQLGYCAGDIAITLGACSGVYIGGGIVPRMAEYLETSSFRSCFDNKGAMTGYMKQIPVMLITEPRAAMLGAATLL